MQPLQVVGQAGQTPLPTHRPQAPQGEPVEAQRFLDDADDRLHGGFAQTLDPLDTRGLELVGHLDDQARILGGGSGP